MKLKSFLQAAQKPKGSIERLLLVAAFAQSAFQSIGRLKCMIPIMGETYEVRPCMQASLCEVIPALSTFPLYTSRQIRRHPDVIEGCLNHKHEADMNTIVGD